jgi:hypothetical protein
MVVNVDRHDEVFVQLLGCKGLIPGHPNPMVNVEPVCGEETR